MRVSNSKKNTYICRKYNFKIELIWVDTQQLLKEFLHLLFRKQYIHGRLLLKV